METRTPISEQEYLSTAYSPDCDYVDGEVQERNLGEWDHSSAQTLLAGYFVARRPTCYRIPDVCVKMGVPNVWALDPLAKTALEIGFKGDWHKVQDGILRTQNPVFEVPMAKIFE